MDCRDLYLRTAVVFGALLVTITETLSAGTAVTRAGLIGAWSAIATAAAIFVLRKYRTSHAGYHAGDPAGPRPRFGIADTLLLTGIAGILGILALIALLSPPNSSDAMAYHLPRVVYWAEQHSVRFFPTPYLNQIMLQPFAEYFMLQSYVISGGDRFVNLGQWFGCATSIAAVSLLARHFGAGRRGQILAALFCVTLPNGILQASGAKNDYLMAAWLAAALWFLTQSGSMPDAVLGGLALGLALVRRVEVGRVGDELRSAGVDPAVDRADAVSLPDRADVVLAASGDERDVAVRESEAFGPEQLERTLLAAGEARLLIDDPP